MVEPLLSDSSTGNPMPSEPLVSVVVTSYTLNRLKDIQDLLESLRDQTYRKLELIFVGERTRELCDRVQENAIAQGVSNVRTIFNEGLPGLSPARNLGTKHSNGEIIAFIDDDAVAFPEWIKAIVGTFQEHNDVIGVTGPAYPLWENESLKWLPEEFYWIISCTSPAWAGRDALREVRNSWGVNMAFRREAFTLQSFSSTFVGGNQGLSDGTKAGLLGDETDFSLRLSNLTKRPIYYNPNAKVFHKVYASRLSGRFISHRAFWEGYTKAFLGRLVKTESNDKLDLSMERALLRRVLIHLFPKLMAQIAFHPLLGWKRLWLAITVIGNVALGYGAARYPFIGKYVTPRFSK